MPGSSTSGRITDLFRSGRQEAIYEAIRTMALDRGIIAEDTPETDVYSFLAGVSEHLEGFTRLQPSEVRGLLNTLRFHPQNMDVRNLYRLVTLLLALATLRPAVAAQAGTSTLTAALTAEDLPTILEESLGTIRRGIANDMARVMADAQVEMLGAVQRAIAESRAEAAARQQTAVGIEATLDDIRALLNSLVTQTKSLPPAETRTEELLPASVASTGPQLAPSAAPTKPVYQRLLPTNPVAAMRHRFMWTIKGVEDSSVTYAGIEYQPPVSVKLPTSTIKTEEPSRAPTGQLTVEFIPESEAPPPPTSRRRGGSQAAPPATIDEESGQESVTIAEAARLAGVTDQTIRNRIKAGSLTLATPRGQRPARVRVADLGLIDREQAPEESTETE